MQFKLSLEFLRERHYLCSSQSYAWALLIASCFGNDLIRRPLFTTRSFRSTFCRASCTRMLVHSRQWLYPLGRVTTSPLLHLPVVFFSMWTRPLVFSRVCPRGSRHLVSISFCTVWQKMMKDSFTKCVIDGVDGCRLSGGVGGLSGGAPPVPLPPLLVLSNWPRIAAARGKMVRWCAFCIKFIRFQGVRSTNLAWQLIKIIIIYMDSFPPFFLRTEREFFICFARHLISFAASVWMALDILISCEICKASHFSAFTISAAVLIEIPILYFHFLVKRTSGVEKKYGQQSFCNCKGFRKQSYMIHMVTLRICFIRRVFFQWEKFLHICSP